MTPSHERGGGKGGGLRLRHHMRGGGAEMTPSHEGGGEGGGLR